MMSPGSCHMRHPNCWWGFWHDDDDGDVDIGRTFSVTFSCLWTGSETTMSFDCIFWQELGFYRPVL